MYIHHFLHYFLYLLTQRLRRYIASAHTAVAPLHTSDTGSTKVFIYLLRQGGLIEPEPCPDLRDDEWISFTMVWEGTTLGEKGVVFLGGEAVLACVCVSDADGSGILGQRLTQVRQSTSACAAWRRAHVEEVDMFMLDGVKIRLPVFWSVEPNGDIRVCANPDTKTAAT